MHTDLSSHLHSEKCLELIYQLKVCHEDYPFRKFIGQCNSIDRDMTACLKQERITRSKLNREKSKANIERIRKLQEEQKKMPCN